MSDQRPGTPYAMASGFGGPWSDPWQSAASLRATASAAGLELRKPPTRDLVAAVIAGHAWCLATGASAMRSAAGLPHGFAVAAAAVISRAAGHGTPADLVSLLDQDPHSPGCSAAALRDVAPALAWGLEQVVADVAHRAPRVPGAVPPAEMLHDQDVALEWAQVLTAAACDLVVGTNTLVADIGWMLAHEAEAVAFAQ